MVTRYEIWAKGYIVPNYDPSDYRKDECGASSDIFKVWSKMKHSMVGNIRSYSCQIQWWFETIPPISDHYTGRTI